MKHQVEKIDTADIGPLVDRLGPARDDVPSGEVLDEGGLSGANIALHTDGEVILREEEAVNDVLESGDADIVHVDDVIGDVAATFGDVAGRDVGQS